MSSPKSRPEARRERTGARGGRRPPGRGNDPSSRGAIRNREASVLSDPPGPPPTLERGRQEIRGRRRPIRGTLRSRRQPRPREISEVSLYADALEPTPRERPPSRGQVIPRPAVPSSPSPVAYRKPVRPSQFPTSSGSRTISRDGAQTEGERGKRYERSRQAIIEAIYGEQTVPTGTSEGQVRSGKHQPLDKLWLKKLPNRTAFLILLLWLPQFFISWIIGWYEFSFFILSNPPDLQDRESDLFRARTSLLVGKSIITIVASALVDCIQSKCDQKYYIYLSLLALFALSPLAGGFATVSMRARLLDEEEHYNGYWFSSIVLAESMISFSFIMFPVQLVCIFSQNNQSSRNGLYLWTSLFVLLEFISAYIAFVTIPVSCPTTYGAQLVAWNVMGPLLVMVAILTVLRLCTFDDMKGAMLMCRKNVVYDRTPHPDAYVAAPADLTKKKLRWFTLLALPVVCSYFSFAVLERFVPNDDWNDHLSSALGVFTGGKILGVVLMMFVIFGVQIVRKGKPGGLKVGMLYLGLPHVLHILALSIIVVRLTSVSHPKEGDVIVGPIPDAERAVFVFISSVFTNRTVCVRSQYFKSFRIRSHQLVTREVYNEVQGLTITFEVDPCSSPARQSKVFEAEVHKGDWKIYDVALLNSNSQGLNYSEYYSSVYAYTLRGVESLRPKLRSSQLVIFQVVTLTSPELWFYRLQHPILDPVLIPANNSAANVIAWDRTAIVWVVTILGNWTVELWSTLYNKSPKASAWAANCIQCVIPLEIELEDNSLYLLMEYFYEEAVPFSINISSFDDPPKERFQGIPLAYKLYKLGELAGPNSNHVPSNQQLQSDWAVQVSMAFAGMAAGGIFVGFVHLFWADPPMPRYRTVTLAAVWVMMGIAAGIPRIVLIEFDLTVSVVLLSMQVAMTALHFIGSSFMLVPKFDFRQ